MSAGNSASKRSGLQVLPGGRRSAAWYGDCRVVAAEECDPPFPVDAVVYEEDTWLVMSADPQTVVCEEHPIRLMTDLMDAEPLSVGQVVIEKDNPLKFLAIVHDVNQEPTWREEWIEAALRKCLAESERMGLYSIALPLLGSKHGRIDPVRFIEIFGSVLQKLAFIHLKRIWLIAPTAKGFELMQHLKHCIEAADKSG